MAMYRTGPATSLITGVVGKDPGTAFKILARDVVLEATTTQRDVTADGDAVTVYANNGLIGGILRIDGWADSANAIIIANLQETTLTTIEITIIAFASTNPEKIVVQCSAERVRVGYRKTEVGVAVSLVLRVSDVNHGTT